jgi:hypothetical protein
VIGFVKFVLPGTRLGWSGNLITLIYLGANILLSGCAVTAALFARKTPACWIKSKFDE